MSLSKILKYSALGLVSFIVAGEMYYKLVEIVREKFSTPDEKRAIYESFCTQSSPVKIQEKKSSSYLVRQMHFKREESLFITEVVENLIKSARRQVHVAMYIFTNRILYEALKEVKQRRGVKVYVIVDHTMESASGSQVQAMQRCGMNVKIYSRATMHHKFCLIDAPCDNNEMEIFLANRNVDKVVGNNNSSNNNNDDDNDGSARIVLPEHGLLITGSLNWTREALLSNVENFVVTSNVNLIKDYQKFFFDCWNET